MCSSLLQLAAEPHDLSQEVLAEQIDKNSTIFTQKDNFVQPRQYSVSFCEFAQLNIKNIVFSAWKKSRDPGANWRKLEHM